MFGAMAAGVVLNEGTVLLLGMGVLGSFTTMSTFAMQAVDYTQHSHTSSALYVLMTVGGSILLAWSGYRAALVLIS
jgi:fluoride ion exporter CrcB/FEX